MSAEDLWANVVRTIITIGIPALITLAFKIWKQINTTIVVSAATEARLKKHEKRLKKHMKKEEFKEREVNSRLTVVESQMDDIKTKLDQLIHIAPKREGDSAS